MEFPIWVKKEGKVGVVSKFIYYIDPAAPSLLTVRGQQHALSKKYFQGVQQLFVFAREGLKHVFGKLKEIWILREEGGAEPQIDLRMSEITISHQYDINRQRFF